MFVSTGKKNNGTFCSQWFNAKNASNPVNPPDAPTVGVNKPGRRIPRERRSFARRVVAGRETREEMRESEVNIEKSATGETTPTFGERTERAMGLMRR
jgi:hypothetical protein